MAGGVYGCFEEGPIRLNPTGSDLKRVSEDRTAGLCIFFAKASMIAGSRYMG